MLAAIAGVMVVCTGCYDAQKIIDQARSEAISRRETEVEIGYFRTTLPRDDSSGIRMEVEIKLFGTAVHYRSEEISDAIEKRSHRLRQAIIIAIRQTEPEDLGDPNLTAIRDRAEMVTGHIEDSLVARPLLHGTRVLDVGTGAGFPGLPLAIAEPERRFTLLDSNNKKIMFVQHAAGVLGLDNVDAVKARTEDYAPGHRFDTVIARAVATVPRLLEIAGHHVGEDGVFVALKGRDPAEELESVPGIWGYDVMQLTVPGLEDGSRHAVLLRRQRAPDSPD